MRYQVRLTGSTTKGYYSTYEGTAAEHAAAIIRLVKADGVDSRRRAA